MDGWMPTCVYRFGVVFSTLYQKEFYSVNGRREAVGLEIGKFFQVSHPRVGCAGPTPRVSRKNLAGHAGPTRE